MKLMDVINFIPSNQKVKIQFSFFNNPFVKSIIFRGSVAMFNATSDDAGNMDGIEIDQIRCSHKSIIFIRCKPCDFDSFCGDRISDENQKVD